MKTGEKLRLVIACVAASLLTAVGSQQILGRDAYAQSNILRTSWLEIVDANGKARGVFAASGGNVVLMLTAPDGNERMGLVVDSTGIPVLRLIDKNGKGGLMMGVDYSNSVAGIYFSDKSEKDRGMITLGNDGSFKISSYDMNEKTVAEWP